MKAAYPDPECWNCDGIGCMSCVLRHVHEVCFNDCPSCCPWPGTESA